MKFGFAAFRYGAAKEIFSRVLLVLAVASLGFGLGGLYAWSFSRHTTVVRESTQTTLQKREQQRVRPDARQFGAPKEYRQPVQHEHADELPEWDAPLGSHF